MVTGPAQTKDFSVNQYFKSASLVKGIQDFFVQIMEGRVSSVTGHGSTWVFLPEALLLPEEDPALEDLTSGGGLTLASADQAGSTALSKRLFGGCMSELYTMTQAMEVSMVACMHGMSVVMQGLETAWLGHSMRHCAWVGVLGMAP